MKYLLLNRIKVQNANAISGFTWGFPAVTHFLGFTHNLSLNLAKTVFSDLQLEGCAVISHETQVHTYGAGKNIQFTQSRNPPYLFGIGNDKKAETAPIIEEGKMNMTISLLIGCEGNIGNRKASIIEWLKKRCMLQRLAGGTILSVKSIDVFDESPTGLRQLKFNLLPGFLLMDRSVELAKHFDEFQGKNNQAELLDAWFDFAAIKQRARPRFELISKHLAGFVEKRGSNGQSSKLLTAWEKHLQQPFNANAIPEIVRDHMAAMEQEKQDPKLLQQWQNYCHPTEKTDAIWESIPKPSKGYLVPIMTGYRAISKVYNNKEIANTRDDETPVCFVEAAHGVGGWLSVHRLKEVEDLQQILWHYYYEENWYLCKQNSLDEPQDVEEGLFGVATEEYVEEDF